MYSKTRNTLTALLAASLFVVAGGLFGQPIAAPAQSQPASIALQASLADAQAHTRSDTPAVHVRYANRMNLAMPYFSFSLQLPQRRND